MNLGAAGSNPAGTASTNGEGASIRARGDGLLSERRPRGLDWGTGGSSIETLPVNATPKGFPLQGEWLTQAERPGRREW